MKIKKIILGYFQYISIFAKTRATFASLKSVLVICGVLLSFQILPNKLLSATRPEIALAPTIITGPISNTQANAIIGKFKKQLAKNFTIISDDQYKKAAYSIFDKVTAEQCTEGYCIYQIKKALNVEKMVILEIVKEDDFSQLKLTLVREEDRQVEEESCFSCTTDDLSHSLDRLIQKFPDLSPDTSSELNMGTTPDQTASQPKVMLNFTERLSKYRYVHLASLVLITGATWSLVNDAGKYNDLAERNDTLSDLAQTAVTKNEFSQYRDEYESNADQMTQYKESLDIYRGILGLAVIFETYMLFFKSAEKEAGQNSSLIHRIEIKPTKEWSFSPVYRITWNW